MSTPTAPQGADPGQPAAGLDARELERIRYGLAQVLEGGSAHVPQAFRDMATLLAEVDRLHAALSALLGEAQPKAEQSLPVTSKLPPGATVQPQAWTMEKALALAGYLTETEWINFEDTEEKERFAEILYRQFEKHLSAPPHQGEAT